MRRREYVKHLLAQKCIGLIIALLPNITVAQKETIFDRVVTIYDSILPVPKVDRLEKTLGIKNGNLVEVGDINLWVEQEGTGTPLVLVCGGPGTSHHYFHPHMSKASKFSRVIYYDLRGVGLSNYTPSIPYTIDQAVNDLENLRKALKIDSWVVLGLSFGGSIAMIYAQKYPDSVMGLVLVSSSLPIPIDIGVGSRQYDFLSDIERERINSIYSTNGNRTIPVHSDEVSRERQQIMLFNGFMNGDWKRRHFTKWTVEDMAMYARYEFTHDKNYYYQMIADHKKYDLTGAFLDNHIPTLIIDGKWDLAYGVQKPDIVGQQFPKAKKLLFENAGHIPFEDSPDLFFKEMADFIRQVEMKE